MSLAGHYGPQFAHDWLKIQPDLPVDLVVSTLIHWLVSYPTNQMLRKPTSGVLDIKSWTLLTFTVDKSQRYFEILTFFLFHFTFSLFKVKSFSLYSIVLLQDKILWLPYYHLADINSHRASEILTLCPRNLFFLFFFFFFYNDFHILLFFFDYSWQKSGGRYF